MNLLRSRSRGVRRAVSRHSMEETSAGQLSFRVHHTAGFYLPPPKQHSLSHCAPNPWPLCAEFQRRDSGSLCARRTLSSNLFDLHGKACAPSSPEHQKHNREKRNERDYGEGFDYYPIFCLFLSLTFWRFLKRTAVALCALSVRHMFASLRLLCVSLESFHALNRLSIFCRNIYIFEDLP